MLNSEREIKKIERLAQKNVRTAGIFTFLFFPLGYLYTGRYKALLKSLGIFAGILFFIFLANPSATQSQETLLVLGLFYTMGAAFDNTLAVSKAKNSLNRRTLINPKLIVQIFKLIKAKGEVSVIDCAVATSLSPKTIQIVLDDLHRQELVRVGSRKGDGAVVYRIS